MPRKKVPTLLIVASAAGVAAQAGADLTCPAWVQLSPEGKQAALRAAIEDRLGQGDFGEWDLDKKAVRRCLLDRQQEIATAFDDACAQPEDADLEALDRILSSYLSSCLG